MSQDIVELPESKLTLSSILKNIRFIRKKKAHINHITGHVNYVAFGSGRNTVLTIHDMESAFTGSKIKNFIILVGFFWLPALIAKRITVISHETKQEVLKYMPFAKSKLRVIYNPVNTHLRHQPKPFNSECPNILCVGTKPNKNLDTIFKALKDVPCKLSIIGRLTTNQEQLLNTLHITYSNVYDISYDEVIKHYQKCDLLCFASTYEGFGMPIIEAQAVGRLVITSNFGAMKEIANDSAYLVNPYDETSIREGVLKLCSDETLRHELLKKSKTNLERFQPQVIAKQYIEVYQDIATS